MTLKPRLNIIGILLKSKFLKNPDEYSIENKYYTQLSFFKYGFIIEKNDDFVSQGELYNPIADEVFVGDVQKSKATIYTFQPSWPFITPKYTLQKNHPLHKRY
jgi:hypothetical protein